jgi:bacterioferritin-associated ferredoxin
MFVCLCHGITDKQIKKIVADGAGTVNSVRKRCLAGSSCGACVCELKSIVEQTKVSRDDSTKN